MHCGWYLARSVCFTFTLPLVYRTRGSFTNNCPKCTHTIFFFVLLLELWNSSQGYPKKNKNASEKEKKKQLEFPVRLFQAEKANGTI